MLVIPHRNHCRNELSVDDAPFKHTMKRLSRAKEIHLVAPVNMIFFLFIFMSLIINLKRPPLKKPLVVSCSSASTHI